MFSFVVIFSVLINAVKSFAFSAYLKLSYCANACILTPPLILLMLINMHCPDEMN